MFLGVAANLWNSSFRALTVTSTDFIYSTPLTRALIEILPPESIFSRKGVVQLDDEAEPGSGKAPTVMLFGARRDTIWVGDNFGHFNFEGPMTRNVCVGMNIVDSTCSRGIGAGPIFYDVGNGVETSFEGHEDLKNYISLDPGALRVQFQGLGGFVFYTQGIESSTLPGTRSDKVPPEIPSITRKALLMFHTFGGVEREAVYLYPNEEHGCPAYLGFFFNGSDGVNVLGGGPANDFVFDTLGFCDPELPFKGSSPDVYTVELVCSGKAQADCPEIVNVFGFLAQEFNFFAVGSGNKAVVLNNSTGGGTFAARDIFNSRSFWIELDDQGWPTGEGFVQPLKDGQNGDRYQEGDLADLLIRFDPAQG